MSLTQRKCIGKAGLHTNFFFLVAQSAPLKSLIINFLLPRNRKFSGPEKKEVWNEWR